MLVLRKYPDKVELSAAVFAINACTHPLVFFALMAVPGAPLTKIALSESFAPLFEALALYYILRLPIKRAVASAIAANFASWQLGPLFTFWLYFS